LLRAAGQVKLARFLIDYEMVRTYCCPMDRKAFILGGAGQIGYAAAWALAEAGWHIKVGSRRSNPAELWPSELGVEGVTVDRADTATLSMALGDGCDLLLDCAAFNAGHGRQLLSFADRIGSAIVISSIAVYVEAALRNAEGGPGQWRSLPIGFTEEHPTMCASPDSYASKKLALEQTLLSADSFPVTILRPGAIYGPYSHYPREWFFVKRALDGRPYRILSYGGRSQFHTTAAVNLAELIRLAAEQPGSRILNAGDPEPPSVQDIAEAISSVLGHHAENVLIEGEPPGPAIGDTPFSAPGPVIMDMSKAVALGYRPKARYADAVESAVRWMVDSAAGRDWQEAFPYFYANQGEEAFDYRAEDEWVARR
jgi:nucleoside-diphosphate-sugar epimerase